MGRRHLYTMGEVAALAGLSRETLHARAFPRPVGTTQGGRRRGPVGASRRVEAIRALRPSRSRSRVRDLLARGRSR